jgi:hypothetical protein
VRDGDDEQPLRGGLESIRTGIECMNRVVISPVVFEVMVLEAGRERGEDHAVAVVSRSMVEVADDADPRGLIGEGPAQRDLAASGLNPEVEDFGQDRERTGVRGGLRASFAPDREHSVADGLARLDLAVLGLGFEDFGDDGAVVRLGW